MRIFLMQHKRSGTRKAVVEKSYGEAVLRARWKEHNVLLLNTYTIDELLINPDIWKQPKPTTPNRIKVK